MIGKVIKVNSNIFVIEDENKNKHSSIISGNVRKNKKVILGDNVTFKLENDKCIIIDVLPRKNQLIRPSIANIDNFFILMSYKEPEFDYKLVDRMIIMANINNIKPSLIITKADLDDGNLIKVIEIYKNLDIDVYITFKNKVSNELKNKLADKISVFSGQSGVGKSSLLNFLIPELNLKVQEISKALSRGKHTTTHFEMYMYFEGMIADTPGFSSIEFEKINYLEIKDKISLFNKCGQCRYSNCLHFEENDCKVKEYFNNKDIGFYQEYKNIVTKLRKETKW